MKLLKFQASWCQPCKALSKTIESLGKIPYQLEEVDIDEKPGLAAQYNVRSVPTLVLVNGEFEVSRMVGALNAAQLKQYLGMT